MRVLVTWRQLVIVAVVTGLTILVLKKIGEHVPVYLSSSNIANMDPYVLKNIFETRETDDLTTEEVREEYRAVDTMLFFVGYSRSRHTLLASLLDAHPHMIVANEKNMFYRVVYGKKMEKDEMFDDLVRGSKGFMKGGKGIEMQGNLQNTSHFGFYMSDYWQGSYDKYIKVIGDKTAWLTSGVFRSTPHDKIIEVVDGIEEKYGVNVKFIHIIRNPFDIVSTITLRNTKLGGGRFGDHSVKVDDPSLLERSASRFFRWAEGSAVAREILGDRLMDVNGLELVTNPVKTLSEICQFLGITCADEYLKACAKVVDPNPSITRNYVVWSKEQMNQMYSEIEQYPFLSHYTFED